MSESKYTKEYLIKKELPIPISSDEIQDMCKEMADKQVKRDAKDAEKTKKNKEYNKDIKMYDNSISLLAACIDSGHDIAVIDVNVCIDFDTKTYMQRRLDTNEVILERPATDDELQPDLPLN